MAHQVKRWIQTLQKYADRWWYAPLISLLALADLFIVIVPTDGLLVSAVMLSPKRWIYTALIVSLGSAIGAWALAAVLEVHGLPFLLSISPGITETSVWGWSNWLMDNWGKWAVFVIAVSPIMQHPVVALAAMAQMPLGEVFVMALAGRAIKYLFLAYLSTHAPGMLNKLWGIQGELEEAGVESGENPSSTKVAGKPANFQT